MATQVQQLEREMQIVGEELRACFSNMAPVKAIVATRRLRTLLALLETARDALASRP